MLAIWRWRLVPGGVRGARPAAVLRVTIIF